MIYQSGYFPLPTFLKASGCSGSGGVGYRIFGTGSGFRGGWRTAGRVWSRFWTLLLVLANFLFWQGGWALGYCSMGFGHIPNIS